jgi:hypothetical protein
MGIGVSRAFGTLFWVNRAANVLSVEAKKKNGGDDGLEPAASAVTVKSLPVTS